MSAIEHQQCLFIKKCKYSLPQQLQGVLKIRNSIEFTTDYFNTMIWKNYWGHLSLSSIHTYHTGMLDTISSEFNDDTVVANSTCSSEKPQYLLQMLL